MTTDNPRVAMQFNDMAQQRRAGVLGMWLFLATELLLFGGLFAAFAIVRLQHPDVFAEAAGHLGLTLGAFNTAILLTSGLTMALAEKASVLGRKRLGLAFVGLTLTLGSAFLAIKGYEWFREYQHHLVPVSGLTFDYPGAEPAIAELFFNFYFIMTGLHAAHMLLGLIAMVWLVWRIRQWKEPDRVARQANIVGLYWAFVDVVWLFVFTCLYLLRA